MNTTQTTDRVRWEAHEIETMAQAFVEERAKDPFAIMGDLLNSAQSLLPEHRRRNLPGLSAAPDLRHRIADLWRARMAATAPEPTIVHVETQRPPDYIDMLNQLDGPSLAAMVVAKFSKELATFKPLLTHLNGANGAPVGAPLQPPISILAAASAKPRKTRVLIIGPFREQFQHIEEKANEAKLPVELQWIDKDKNSIGVPISTDYVIVTKFTSHAHHDALKRTIPPGKFFYLEGGITAVVQKLRDIAALLPPRA